MSSYAVNNSHLKLLDKVRETGAAGYQPPIFARGEPAGIAFENAIRPLALLVNQGCLYSLGAGLAKRWFLTDYGETVLSLNEKRLPEREYPQVYTIPEYKGNNIRWWRSF